MTRVHDMGGRFGDGPVIPEAEEGPKFAAEWQERALVLTLACGALGAWNIDMSRHAREGLAPTDYARFSYYEKWIAALIDLLVEKGLVNEDELRSGTADPRPLHDRALRADKVAAVLAKGGPADRPSDIAPRFAPGDRVVTRRHAANTMVPGGHTRLPGYAESAVGTVVILHGTHIFPDSSAHGLGEASQPLYAVAFPASELWTAPEHPGDEVVIDLWQSYLEPA